MWLVSKSVFFTRNCEVLDSVGCSYYNKNKDHPVNYTKASTLFPATKWHLRSAPFRPVARFIYIRSALYNDLLFILFG